MSDFGEMGHPVARKDYKCLWCAEVILRGEKHAHFTGMWQGDFQNWRMHLECETATDKGRVDFDDGIEFGMGKRGLDETR